MPNIGRWRAPERIRAGWQVFDIGQWQKDGVESWRTVAHALQIKGPIAVAHLRFDDDSTVGVPVGDGYELFTRTTSEAERARAVAS